MIYEIVIGILVYAVLFVVTVQSSRRKVQDLQARLDKVHSLQQQQQAQSQQSVASTRSRLYQKVFGQKGSSKDWDDFVLSL